MLVGGPSFLRRSQKGAGIWCEAVLPLVLAKALCWRTGEEGRGLLGSYQIVCYDNED